MLTVAVPPQPVSSQSASQPVGFWRAAAVVQYSTAGGNYDIKAITSGWQ